MMRVLSLGAGVQSSTLALMMAAGEVETVDCAIFADTKSEPAAVYAWLRELEALLPFPIHRVSRGNLEADILADERKEMRYMLPTFTSDGGMGKRQCTRAYKIRPIQAEIRALGGGLSNPVRQFIGISWDEMHRMKPSGVSYIQNVYPLVERRLTRGHCLEWLDAHHYRRPPKSSCTFCPYGDFSRLEDVELDRVIALDEFIRHRSGTVGVQQFLSRERRPLVEIDVHARSGQQELFGDECEGLCGV